MSGYKHEEIIGSDIINFIDPDYRDYVQEKIKNKNEKAYEVMGIRKNGESYPVSIQGKKCNV